MLKRCLSPLTLVNQVALIVLLSTAIGLAGMAVSGWLVQGVQGSAHAINKAGSLRMQSYRLLAAVPLSEKDKPLIKEMEQTAFSAELTRAAERDGQLAQLQGLIVSLRKITEIIWKVEPLPSPAVRNSARKTAKNAMKLPPCPSVGKVRNSRPLKIAIRIKFTSVTRVPPRRSDNAPPAERASAPINGPKKAYCRI